MNKIQTNRAQTKLNQMNIVATGIATGRRIEKENGFKRDLELPP